MPYTKKNLPQAIKKLPTHAQDIWMAAFNSAFDQYEGDEERAHATAWSAVKQKYEQDAKGNWKPKQEAAKAIGTDLCAFVSLDSRGDVWSDTPDWSPGDTPPEWIRVLPLGKVLLNDDRQPFTVTKESIKKVMDKFASTKVDMVIDYEHQTMSGDKAPAAGWVKELRERPDGLWAFVQWTPTAREHIQGKEYRYYSPTVRLDSQRIVQELLHIGLTNFPAISGIPPLTLNRKNNSLNGGDSGMLEKLNAVLGLGEDSPEVDALMMVRDLMDVKKICDGSQQKINEQASRIEELSSKLTDTELRAVRAESDLNKVAVPVTVIESLGVKKDSTVHELVTRIEALKLAAERAAELDKQIAAMKGSQLQSEADRMIDEALKTGRTSPEELERGDGKLKKLATDDPEFFKTFVLGREAGSIVPLHRLPQIQESAKANQDPIPPVIEKMIQNGQLTLDQYKAQLEMEKKGTPFAGFTN